MRVLIADDHDLLRDTLVMFLNGQPDLDVEGVGSYDDVVAETNASGAVDLLILDYRMPGMNGLDGLRDAIERGRGKRVALMSGDVTRSVVESALEAGAAGFIPKTLPAKSVRNAVAFMLMGETYLPADLLRETESVPDGRLQALSKREREVLRGLCDGKSNKQIALELSLSEATVKLHVKTIYRHLGVANRTQAALIARDQGLT